MTLLFLAPFVSMKMGESHTDVCRTTFVVVHLEANCLDLVSKTNMLGVDLTTDKQMIYLWLSYLQTNIMETFWT